MIRITQLKLTPSQDREALEKAIRKTLRITADEEFSFEVLRQAVDARKKPDLFYVYTVSITLPDEKRERQVLKKCRDRNVELFVLPEYRYSRNRLTQDGRIRDEKKQSGSAERLSTDSKVSPGFRYRPVIVGTGPAGLFCGLLLARAGLCPILIERGERARERVRSVGAFWDGGNLDPESNVQFGEGGAGTFSDGKLNTGIKDPEGRIRFILQTFVDAGADPEILYSYRPHVGTDVLTSVVTHITDEITERGGTVYFNTKLERLTAAEEGTWQLECRKKHTAGGSSSDADGNPSGEMIHITSSHVVLAIGHSARDTFRMLKEQGIRMTAKAFAVGLRIQHPQDMIDRAMYGDGCPYAMPPSPYKLTHRLSDGRGVYSFCMCPGGYVVNASSEQGMLAVNGMSYHDRSSGNANSAVVVTVSPEEIAGYLSEAGCVQADILQGMEFQRMLEKAAYREGGGCIPLQRFEDYRNRETGTKDFCFEPELKGKWKKGNLRAILPERIGEGIEEGILSWERQIPGFSSPEAILAGVESRTSSPVRIERGDDLQASDNPGLYPCGEGAGYAGGITSAAADGLRVAEAIIDACPIC